MSEPQEKAFQFLSATEGKEKDVKLTEISEYSINVRFANNLDIPSMVDWIQAMGGKILTSVWLWEPSETDRKKLGIVGRFVAIQGYRRIGACKWIDSHPDQFSATLVNNVQKIPALVFSGISRDDAENMVMDHGSTKPLAKSEIVWSIFRLYYAGHSATEIMTRMAKQIARDLKGVSAADLQEYDAMTDPAQRKAWVRDKLQNVVNNQIIRSAKLGKAIAEQVIYYFKFTDGLLEESEQMMFKANTTALQRLSGAAKVDQDSAQFESVNELKLNDNNELVIRGGGPQIRGVLHELHNSFFNKGGGDATPQRMMPRREVEARASSFASKALKATLGMVTGDTSTNVLEVDAEIYRLERIMETLTAFMDAGGFKVKTLTEVVDALLNKPTDEIEKLLGSHCDPEVGKKATAKLEELANSREKKKPAPTT